MLKPTDKAAFLGVRNDIYDSAGKKSQEPLTFSACYRRDSLYGHLYRIEYPDAFYEDRCVVHTDHVRPFIGGSGRSQLLGPKGGLQLVL